MAKLEILKAKRKADIPIKKADKPSPEGYRGNANSRGYTYKWQKYREKFLFKNPLCAYCSQVATVVDHIKPHRGDMTLFWDTKNHQSLCTNCHSSVKQKEERGM